MTIKRAAQHLGFNHRREWSLIILLLVLAILSMGLASQHALRILPTWRVNADMSSLINPDGTFAAYWSGGQIEPVAQQILTPYSFEYLTPGPTSTPIMTSEPAVTRTPTSTGTVTLTVPAQATDNPTFTPKSTNTRIVIYYTHTYTRANTAFSASTATRTATPSATGSRTASATASTSRTITPTRSSTSSRTGSPTRTWTTSRTFTPTKSLSPSPTVTETKSPTASRTTTSTKSPTSSRTYTTTDTRTPTRTTTRTITFTSTLTLTASYTPIPSQTHTSTITFTSTSTFTHTETLTPTLTSTPTDTYTPSFTPTFTQTFTVTHTPTDTPPIVPPTCSTNDPADINIGPGDGSCTTLDTGYGPIVLDLGSSPIRTHGDGGWDLLFYERAVDPGIQMDFLIIEISPDNVTWYTIFAFGSGIAFNSSIGAYPEVDNSPIPISALLGSVVRTGVGIDIDHAALNGGLGIPPGSYRYLRITSPADSDGGCDVDAIEVIP